MVITGASHVPDQGSSPCTGISFYPFDSQSSICPTTQHSLHTVLSVTAIICDAMRLIIWCLTFILINFICLEWEQDETSTVSTKRVRKQCKQAGKLSWKSSMIQKVASILIFWISRQNYRRTVVYPACCSVSAERAESPPCFNTRTTTTLERKTYNIQEHIIIFTSQSWWGTSR